MRSCHIRGPIALIAALASAGPGDAAQCGSALLLEVAAPAAFDGVDAALPITARFWEAGLGGSNGSASGCAVGCTLATGAMCSGGVDCLALTGVSWLNAACTTTGRLPTRTVFVVEQTTVDSGGRFAALNVDRNAADANTDLDARALAVCAGCASVLSPLIGGLGAPEVVGSSVAGGTLSASLSWSAPPAAAQALSNGSELVTSYAVFWRGHVGEPPPSTGDPTGWTLALDLESDGSSNGGYSTDTSAEVEAPIPLGIASVTFAIGLNFDGSGNPTADGNTVPSSFLSDQSDAVMVGPTLLFADGFESGDTSAWSTVVP